MMHQALLSDRFFVEVMCRSERFCELTRNSFGFFIEVTGTRKSGTKERNTSLAEILSVGWAPI